MLEPNKVQHPNIEAEGLLVSKDSLEVQSLIVYPRVLSDDVSSQKSVADLSILRAQDRLSLAALYSPRPGLRRPCHRSKGVQLRYMAQ